MKDDPVVRQHFHLYTGDQKLTQLATFAQNCINLSMLSSLKVRASTSLITFQYNFKGINGMKDLSYSQ